MAARAKRKIRALYEEFDRLAADLASLKRKIDDSTAHMDKWAKLACERLNGSHEVGAGTGQPLGRHGKDRPC